MQRYTNNYVFIDYKIDLEFLKWFDLQKCKTVTPYQ